MCINHFYLLSTVTCFIILGVGSIEGQGNAFTDFGSAYQTPGFNNSNIRSGPIVVVDKRTIFIPSLHYNGNYSNAHFWVGKGKPSVGGTLVPDENNCNDTLNAYSDRNIYLKLPASLTTDTIDYIGIWSKEWGDVGHVMLYLGADSAWRNHIPEALGHDQKTEDNKLIFRVPKCCGPSEYFSTNGSCLRSKQEIKVGYRVFESNITHINNDTFMDNVEFVPYTKNLKCPPNYKRFLLDETFIFGFLYNSTIIYYDTYTGNHGIFSHEDFCMDIYEGSNETSFLFCEKTEGKEASIMPNIYLPLLFISLICFILSSISFLFILKVPEVQYKCLVGYSTSMAFTFLFLILLQLVNSSCNCLGSLFIFFTICSFVWLTCLCLELIPTVCSFDVDETAEEDRKIKKDYFYYYAFSSILIPFITVLISLVGDGTPGVPKSFLKQYFMHDMCSFEGGNKLIFFIPIGMLISISFIALCVALYKIAMFEKTEKNKYDWLKNQGTYKFRLISYFITCITLCVWFVEIVAMGKALQFAIDIIEASAGIFALFIFVLNKYTRKEIMDELKSNETRQPRQISFGEFMALDQTTDENRENQNQIPSTPTT